MGGFQKQVKRGTWLWFWVWLARFFFCKFFLANSQYSFCYLQSLISFPSNTQHFFHLLKKIFWFSSNFWKLFSLLQDHCGLGCTFENIPSAANSHGILLFSDLLMMQFSKCIFHSDRLHLYSSDFISAVFWFPIWQNFNFYLQILWQSPELILIGSYFTKAPLPQIQLRFSVGLKTAERQFMTFASPPFNRWDIWGKHQDIALSEGIQKKWRKQKYI